MVKTQCFRRTQMNGRRLAIPHRSISVFHDYRFVRLASEPEIVVCACNHHRQYRLETERYKQEAYIFTIQNIVPPLKKKEIPINSTNV